MNKHIEIHGDEGESLIAPERQVILSRDKCIDGELRWHGGIGDARTMVCITESEYERLRSLLLEGGQERR